MIIGDYEIIYWQKKHIPLLASIITIHQITVSRSI